MIITIYIIILHIFLAWLYVRNRQLNDILVSKRIRIYNLEKRLEDLINK
jgi:hypothetical protein